jgi:hypothetical protein
MNAALKHMLVKQLQKAKGHLEYSYRKVKAMQLANELTEEQLETLESFSSRFARFSDLIVSKYFRALALEKDPAFRGSVIDLLNIAEKFGWVSDAKIWVRIRELRNVAAHEYAIEDYKSLYTELIDLAPHLLNVPLDL